jgi:hypothetical protein
VRCHESTAAAIPAAMLDNPGSNPGVNYGWMYMSRRTNVFCLVLSNFVVYRQFGKKPVDVSVYLFIYLFIFFNSGVKKKLINIRFFL